MDPQDPRPAEAGQSPPASPAPAPPAAAEGASQPVPQHVPAPPPPASPGRDDRRRRADRDWDRDEEDHDGGRDLDREQDRDRGRDREDDDYDFERAGRRRRRHRPDSHRTREHRRRRLRRHGRRAYVRSIYFLPSLCTLGNAICGFAAIYIAGLDQGAVGADPWTNWFYKYRFLAAAYMVFIAMLFDALDGRLARFTRHTTDFGGQLDSLADVISFGVAPAFMALQLVKHHHSGVPFVLSRLFWGLGAVYMSCAAMRLARFNVSNKHGEQHHFSFLGLPSPGAAGAVAGIILMQQDMAYESQTIKTVWLANTLGYTANALVYALPPMVLITGVLMISNIRYPHLVNKYLRGRRSIARVVTMAAVLLLVFLAHRQMLAIGCTVYALSGPLSWAWLRTRGWRAGPAPGAGPAPVPGPAPLGVTPETPPAPGSPPQP